MADDARKTELIAELAKARAGAAASALALREDLNVNARLKEGFEHHRLTWIGSAAVLGLLLAKIPARKKKVVVGRKGLDQVGAAGKAGLALGALKIALDFARPAATAWLTKRFTGYARRPPGPGAGRS